MKRAAVDVPDAAQPAVIALLRALGEHLLDEPTAMSEEVHAAVADTLVGDFRSQSRLVEETMASTGGNVRGWATALAGYPAVPEIPVSPVALAIAREALRRGQEDMLLAAYRRGQQALWVYCMRYLFGLTDDHGVLSAALGVASTSLSDYIDVLVQQLRQRISSERDRIAEDRQEERRALVNLVLEGAPLTTDRAAERLGYPLAGPHLAAVLWTDANLPDRSALRRTAERLQAEVGATHLLWVQVSASSWWVWVDHPGVERDLGPFDANVRVAMGVADSGIEGFRRSHSSALGIQSAMYRAPQVAFARADEVRAVALATQDESAAREFVAGVLGDLAGGPVELREVLRVHIAGGANSAATARRLFAHRNTVLGRLRRAEALMPRPLEGRLVEVGLALEILHWLGE